eukprot:Nk52_evm25s151 gene=Nk52_evmTU25s151
MGDDVKGKAPQPLLTFTTTIQSRHSSSSSSSPSPSTSASSSQAPSANNHPGAGCSLGHWEPPQVPYADGAGSHPSCSPSSSPGIPHIVLNSHRSSRSSCDHQDIVMGSCSGSSSSSSIPYGSRMAPPGGGMFKHGKLFNEEFQQQEELVKKTKKTPEERDHKVPMLVNSQYPHHAPPPLVQDSVNTRTGSWNDDLGTSSQVSEAGINIEGQYGEEPPMRTAEAYAGAAGWESSGPWGAGGSVERDISALQVLEHLHVSEWVNSNKHFFLVLGLIFLYSHKWGLLLTSWFWGVLLFSNRAFVEEQKYMFSRSKNSRSSMSSVLIIFVLLAGNLLCCHFLTELSSHNTQTDVFEKSSFVDYEPSIGKFKNMARPIPLHTNHPSKYHHSNSAREKSTLLSRENNLSGAGSSEMLEDRRRMNFGPSVQALALRDSSDAVAKGTAKPSRSNALPAKAFSSEYYMPRAPSSRNNENTGTEAQISSANEESALKRTNMKSANIVPGNVETNMMRSDAVSSSQTTSKEPLTHGKKSTGEHVEPDSHIKTENIEWRDPVYQHKSASLERHRRAVIDEEIDAQEIVMESEGVISSILHSISGLVQHLSNHLYDNFVFKYVNSLDSVGKPVHSGDHRQTKVQPYTPIWNIIYVVTMNDIWTIYLTLMVKCLCSLFFSLRMNGLCKLQKKGHYGRRLIHCNGSWSIVCSDWWWPFTSFGRTPSHASCTHVMSGIPSHVQTPSTSSINTTSGSSKGPMESCASTTTESSQSLEMGSMDKCGLNGFSGDDNTYIDGTEDPPGYIDRCTLNKMQMLPQKNLANLYMLVEAISQIIRFILPVYFWAQYFHSVSILFIGLPALDIYYCGRKMVSFFFYLERLYQALYLYSSESQPYGKKVTLESLSEDGNSFCTICQDTYTDPLVLDCKHAYCEACVSEWFEREPTCPMCRTPVPMAGSRKNRNGSTDILPFVF